MWLDSLQIICCVESVTAIGEPRTVGARGARPSGAAIRPDAWHVKWTGANFLAWVLQIDLDIGTSRAPRKGRPYEKSQRFWRTWGVWHAPATRISLRHLQCPERRPPTPMIRLPLRWEPTTTVCLTHDDGMDITPAIQFTRLSVARALAGRADDPLTTALGIDHYRPPDP